MDIYHKRYIGKLKITKLHPGYSIEFGLNTPEAPYVICATLEDKEFLEYLRKQIKNSSRFLEHYF
jgi:hypothetical protein